MPPKKEDFSSGGSSAADMVMQEILSETPASATANAPVESSEKLFVERGGSKPSPGEVSQGSLSLLDLEDEDVKLITAVSAGPRQVQPVRFADEVEKERQLEQQKLQKEQQRRQQQEQQIGEEEQGDGGESGGSLRPGAARKQTRNGSFNRSRCVSMLDDALHRPDFHLAKTNLDTLRKAALGGDPELVRRMIDLGASVNAPIKCVDKEGDIFITLLHVLCSCPDLPKRTEVMAEIARGKANLNARSSIGSTPLARACYYKHTSAVELLLELGADVTPIDDVGRSAVHCAVSLRCETSEEIPHDPLSGAPPAGAGRSDLAQASGVLVALLARRGANLHGASASLANVGAGSANIAPVQSVISGPGMEDAGPAEEVPPLLDALRQQNHPALSALIKHGVKPRFLHAAVDKAPVTMIDELLKSQANPLEEDSEGRTILDCAFKRGDEEITSLLRDFIGDYERKHHVSSSKLLGFSNTASLNSRGDDTVDHEDEEGGLGLTREKKKISREPLQPPLPPRASRKLSNVASSLINRKRGISSEGLSNPSSSHIARLWCKEKFTQLQVLCRRLNRNRNFQAVMFAALIAALFCPDLWILFDVASNDGLDGVIIVVFFCFLIELVVQTIGMPKTYVNSFFFWMDVIGFLSVPLDHSLVSESLPRNLDNAVVLRAARTARLGARAGRFTKLVKLLRFLPGVHEDTSGKKHGTAKTMSNALMTSLSTRVSCLIILMVMVLPLFELSTYPENDFSMKAWLNSLELSLGVHGPELLERRVLDFEAFYRDKDYFPFEVHWSANGTMNSKILEGKRPRKETSSLTIKADEGNVSALFNFGAKYRVDALCNIVLMIVIIFLMIGFAMLLSNSVSVIVLQPLENLLAGVQGMASKIFKSVTNMATKLAHEGDQDEGNEEDAGDIGNETELLEKVINKLATLSAISMKQSPIDAETLEQLGETDRAVLQGFSPTNLRELQAGPKLSSVSGGSQEEEQTEELVQTLEKLLGEAGLSWNLVDSWDFNALELEEEQRQLSCLCFNVLHLGLLYDVKMQASLVGFVEAASAGYSSPQRVPYHNWYHAVDVTHCVFRLLNLCATEKFFSNHERFALVASAVCHDIGHPGLNNPFLVETAHDLAIRYNDRSPLENMHCAKLFEIIGQPKSAIFSMFDRQQYKEVRNVCIEAILHTDNIHHFPMVKELQMLYEMNSDVFDLAMQAHQSGQLIFPPHEIWEIMQEPDKKKLMRNLFLHFSDISNPTKPFHICKSWAWCIIDEFFLQGDREKELGIAVQPLNDREKVNKPYSQVGFIEFFVAPFAFATVRLLPPLVACTDQMMANMNEWFEEWRSTANPPPEQEDIAKLQERIQKLEAKFIFREGF